MLKTLSKKVICSVVLSFKCGHFCAFLGSSSKKIGPDLLHEGGQRPMIKDQEGESDGGSCSILELNL